MELLLYRELFEAELQRLSFNRAKRVMRDESDPFALPETTFKQMYRVSKNVGHHLLGVLGPHMRNGMRISSIPKCLRLFATLHFLGNGSYQRPVGQDFLLSMHQTSINKCISEITDLIVEVLGHLIKFPSTDEEENQQKLLFTQNGIFPGVIGCIDGTQIAIIAPKTQDPVMPGVIFYCRKLYYSLNVQIICDPQLKILNINARFPGSVHDSAIWQTSLVRQHLRAKYLVDRTRSSYLLGDSGYPLEPWLLTPIAGPTNEHESAYNLAHRSARNVIERTNGVLKSRFRCTFKHRTLNYSPQRSAQIINSCAILHNLCVDRNDIWDIDDPDVDNPHDVDIPEVPEENPAENQIEENNNFQLGRNIRNLVVQRYF